jgi:hypothetical protein
VLVARTVTAVFPVEAGVEEEDELPPQPAVKVAASARLDAHRRQERREEERDGAEFITFLSKFHSRHCERIDLSNKRRRRANINPLYSPFNHQFSGIG